MAIALCLAAMVALTTAIILSASLLAPTESLLAAERLQEVTRSGEERRYQAGLLKKTTEGSAKLAGWLRAHLGLTENAGLQQRFVHAGLDPTMAGDLYQSARIVGPILLLIAGSLIPFARVFWMAALPALGYLLPDFVLARTIRKRRAAIRRSIPDVIDLLVICVEAGLGLDQAMLRVAEELSISHPEINQEILHINREQRAGRPRSEAWQAMGERVKLKDIDALVNMLMQTERFGTPISKALNVFAVNLRIKRRQAAEEMAQKTTIKIIFPLVLFIFPAMFIVLLGPAVLNIMHTMSATPK